ncbi:MAG: YrhK family protein [Desulfovermiculus sp.]|nr:YrhK family protein [Desulfovermiculus sp.]
MPHMFTNRPRLYNLTAHRDDLGKRFRWETINAVLYKLGGIVFIVGSILFFPKLHTYKDMGCWTFFLGSLLYLVVTVHDFVEVHFHWRTSGPHDSKSLLEYVAAASYVLGTVLFTVGSIFFLSQVGWTIAGAWFFVIGSLLFVIGACINVLQIIYSQNLLTLQLLNLTAVAFVVGSVLFTVASVPYLWHFKSAYDSKILDAFLAWQYLVGSLLFFTGGVFNYWRAYVIIREEIAVQEGSGKKSVPETH